MTIYTAVLYIAAIIWVYWKACVWLDRRMVRRDIKARAQVLEEVTSCQHSKAVEVRTDNDLDRGTLVAWWCAACETQLPPGTFNRDVPQSPKSIDWAIRRPGTYPDLADPQWSRGTDGVWVQKDVPGLDTHGQRSLDYLARLGLR